MINEEELEALRTLKPRFREQEAVFDTVEVLWKIARAADRYYMSAMHHARDVDLEWALLELRRDEAERKAETENAISDTKLDNSSVISH
jgi:hypothetical protein